MNKHLVILLLTSFLAACVTINIYFPAAAAQEVADEIIDDVWQLKKDEEAKDASSTEDANTDTSTSN
jgi:hypothetical protein